MPKKWLITVVQKQNSGTNAIRISDYCLRIYSSHFWGKIGFSKISKFHGLLACAVFAFLKTYFRNFRLTCISEVVSKLSSNGNESFSI
ncbi:hypothetical protein T11_11177, partial [Trichinella zimbabwensis]